MDTLITPNYYPFTDYPSNEEVIQKINNFIEKGYKINLFIGKCPSRGEAPLPECQGKEIWVSLAIATANKEFPLDSNRLHLVMSCQETEEMKKIHGLFNHVVIDLNTTKYLDGALENIIGLVKPGGSFVMPNQPEFFFEEGLNDTIFTDFHVKMSTKKLGESIKAHQENSTRLIIEFCHQLGDLQVACDMTSASKTKSAYIAAYKVLIPNSQEYKDWAASPDYVPGSTIEFQIGAFLTFYTRKRLGHENEGEEQIAREKTKARLLEYFDHVEIHHNPYPYRNLRYDNNGKAVFYFTTASERI